MKIKDLILDKLEISITQFCKIIGVSRQTIYFIINGKTKDPARTTIKKICKYFDVDFRDYI